VGVPQDEGIRIPSDGIEFGLAHSLGASSALDTFAGATPLLCYIFADTTPKGLLGMVYQKGLLGAVCRKGLLETVYRKGLLRTIYRKRLLGTICRKGLLGTVCQKELVGTVCRKGLLDVPE
jgi:hypothetical protein